MCYRTFLRVELQHSMTTYDNHSMTYSISFILKIYSVLSVDLKPGNLEGRTHTKEKNPKIVNLHFYVKLFRDIPGFGFTKTLF